MKNFKFVFFVSLFVCTLHAEEKKFVVLLAVPSMFGRYEDETRSYLKRELREIKDIELVEKAPFDFFISVVPAPLDSSPGREPFGIALSSFFEHGTTKSHNVNIFEPSELKHMCQKIVAEFDNLYLEPLRK